MERGGRRRVPETGRNRHLMAAGPMADVITVSTRRMRDTDLATIVAYLKELPPVGEHDPVSQPAAATRHRRDGACVLEHETGLEPATPTSASRSELRSGTKTHERTAARRSERQPVAGRRARA
jgi:hypothetical protein